MRKIGSEQEDDRKKKRNVLYISGFMLLILVGGTVGYGFLSGSSNSISGTDSELTEGEVTQVGNQWTVRIGSQFFYFSNSPESIQEVQVDISNNLNSYVGTTLYIVSENDAILSQLGSLLSGYAARVQEACHGPCEENLPEKECSDNLIVWIDSLENKVYQEDNCIFIEGDTRAVDAFIYRMIGIN
jgi:hypothetical protein